MTQYRWITSALCGRWCSSPEEALYDALRAGQGFQTLANSDQITLHEFARVEEQRLNAVAWAA